MSDDYFESRLTMFAAIRLYVRTIFQRFYPYRVYYAFISLIVLTLAPIHLA